MRRSLSSVFCLLLGLAVALETPARGAEDEASAAKRPAEGPATVSATAPAGAPQVQWAAPEVAPADRTPRPGASRTAKPSARTKALPEPLASMQAVSVKDGVARVRMPEGERTLRPGDPVGADRVRAVSDGVMVLDRPAVPGTPGGSATVIVRFDAAGQARVRVLYESDPTPLRVPEAR
jgi:hypothetical protein